LAYYRISIPIIIGIEKAPLKFEKWMINSKRR